MKRLLLWSSLLLISISLFAQTTAGLTPGADLLFRNTKSKLTTAEKNSLYASTGFLLSADKKQFIADKEAAEFPFDATVYPTDLNGDGKEEIFILFGNTYTSGATGSSIVMYIKNSGGKYVSNLGFPGTLPYALPAPAKAYPDLIIGGMGFSFPVWKWNGKAYAYNRKFSDKMFEKYKTENIESVSKKYTDKL